MKKVNFKTLGLLVGVGIIALGGTILPTADAEANKFKDFFHKLFHKGKHHVHKLSKDPKVKGAIKGLTAPVVQAAKDSGKQIADTAKQTGNQVLKNTQASLEKSTKDFSNKIQKAGDQLNTSIKNAGDKVSQRLAGLAPAATPQGESAKNKTEALDNKQLAAKTEAGSEQAAPAA